MQTIIQGDQYDLPISLKNNGETVTPSSIDKLVIQVDEKVKTYPGELVFDSTSQQWLYPLTQRQTLKFQHSFVPVQAQITIDGNVQSTMAINIPITASIIRERT